MKLLRQLFLSLSVLIIIASSTPLLSAVAKEVNIANANLIDEESGSIQNLDYEYFDGGYADKARKKKEKEDERKQKELVKKIEAIEKEEAKLVKEHEKAIFTAKKDAERILLARKEEQKRAVLEEKRAQEKKELAAKKAKAKAELAKKQAAEKVRKAKLAAEKAAEKKEKERLKALAKAEKEKKRAELAKEKAKLAAKKAEEKAELIAKKAAEKKEKDRLAAIAKAEKEKKQAELAKIKAEQDKLRAEEKAKLAAKKAEEKKILAEKKAKEKAELAAKKAELAAKKAAEKKEKDRLAAIAKAEKEKKKAKLAAEKKLLAQKLAEEKAKQEAIKAKQREREALRKQALREEKAKAKAIAKAAREAEKERKKAAKKREKTQKELDRIVKRDTQIQKRESNVIRLTDTPKITKSPELAEMRTRLKKDEKEALEFIFPSVEQEKEKLLAAEEFFTESEKEQLLELWRATIARNRTIQFIIKALSPNPKALEKNNAILQSLSKAVFVPFYAVSAVSDSTLINSGSSVGARVIGDMMDDINSKRSKTKELKRTDMMIMFMLVDEVAERLRGAYRDYKLVKVEKDLLKHELEFAKVDAVEALDISDPRAAATKFVTRSIVRNRESQLRRLNMEYRASKGILIELAGSEAVESTDILIDLELESVLDEVSNI